MSNAEAKRGEPVLNPREQKLVDMVTQDMQDLRLFKTQPKPYRAKVGEGEEQLDMKKVANVLHNQGINIAQSYRFDEQQKTHFFTPELYEGAPRSPRDGKSTTPYSDFFNEMFGTSKPPASG